MTVESFRSDWKRFWSLVGQGSEAPSNVLKNLISEVEDSEGYARNDVRTKAKTWLISHVSTLDEEDVLLARDHFGYLLPMDWGIPATQCADPKF
jgi:hypothetical protein